MESTNAKIKEEPEDFDSTEFGFDYDSIMQSELFEEGDNHKGNGESFVNQDGNEGTQLNYRHHYHYRCRVFTLPN